MILLEIRKILAPKYGFSKYRLLKEKGKREIQFAPF